MSFLFHFHMLTLTTSLFKQFSWWCAILFFKPVWRASFLKIQKFREKEVGKWFLKWKTFLRRWNWEEKSSTIYHCTVFGWVIKSVLPFVLLRVWFKYSRWQKKLFNTDFWFLNPVKMFWSSQKCWGWPKIVLDSVQRGKKGVMVLVHLHFWKILGPGPKLFDLVQIF